MHTRSLIATGMVCATVVAVAGFLSNAGPLTPPAGPIAPTPGPEPRIAISASNTPGDADSLFKITQPGSYYLTGNITGVSNKDGIEIAASGVTLDLNGYALIGVAGSLDGINMPMFFREDVVIRNGAVSDWGGDGVKARIENGAIENVHARRNGGWGIDNDGAFSSRITGCSAFQNGSDVPSTGGIRASRGATVQSCQARNNTGDGIVAGIGSTISGSAARNNTGDGIIADIGSTVSGNSASNNTGDGIVAHRGSTVSGNSTSNNTGDGIEVSNDVFVLNNACHGNGGAGDGAGVHATGSDNRIEGNNVTDNGRGVDVDGSGNIIIRNSASGNTTHYDIAVGNTLGQVFDFSGGGAISSSVVNGFGAWAGPWANFSF